MVWRPETCLSDRVFAIYLTMTSGAVYGVELTDRPMAEALLRFLGLPQRRTEHYDRAVGTLDGMAPRPWADAGYMWTCMETEELWIPFKRLLE